MSKKIKFSELLSYQWLKTCYIKEPHHLKLKLAFLDTYFSNEVKALPFFKKTRFLHQELGFTNMLTCYYVRYGYLNEPINMIVFDDRRRNLPLALDRKSAIALALVENIFLTALRTATNTWCRSLTALLILYKIVYPALNRRFGEHEFWRFEFWLGSILAINELIKLLFSMNSKLDLKDHDAFNLYGPPSQYEFMRKIQPKTIFTESLNLPKNLNNLSKDYFLKAIFENLKAEDADSFVDMAYAFIQQDKRSNAFLSDDKVSSVEKFIFSYLNKLSLNTLRFLYLNKLFSIADLKNAAKAYAAVSPRPRLKEIKLLKPLKFCP